MSSFLRRWALAACLIPAGCLSSQRFEEVAPGVSVTRESIDNYAAQHGITRDEAKQRITEEVTSTGGTTPGSVRALEVVTGQELDGPRP